MTWFPSNLTIIVVFSINGVVVARRTIVDTIPLVICESDYCTACLQVQNLNITDQGACGRIYANFSCINFQEQWDLGQFHLGTNCVIGPHLEQGSENVIKTKTIAAKIPRDIPLYNNHEDRRRDEENTFKGLVKETHKIALNHDDRQQPPIPVAVADPPATITRRVSLPATAALGRTSKVADEMRERRRDLISPRNSRGGLLRAREHTQSIDRVRAAERVREIAQMKTRNKNKAAIVDDAI
jgi:hypothetical protein